jgi:4-amino-4-deoxy-L-arabinose transferase-like glycosyltransferase
MIFTDQPAEAAARRWAWRLAAALLILGSAALRVVYLAHDCPLDLAPDEAHYWDWSRHLDWSYYSKGPLVALLIRLSCELFGSWSRSLIGTEMLAVRLPAVICGALLVTSLYVLSVQVCRRERWALATVGIALTLPLIAAGSSLMTIDAPFTCAWGWALVFGHRALFRGSAWAWPAAGLCVLVGVLAKHTMVLWIPCLGLFLLTTPAFRQLLWCGRFWLMTVIGALGGLPILLWNVQHGWVTLLHTQQSHAGMSEDDGFSWIGPLRYVGMQFLVLLGFWFVMWARAVWVHHPGREPRSEIRYLWWMSVPVIVFFFLFSFFNGGGEANWPVAGYLSGAVLTAASLVRALRDPRPVQHGVLYASVALTCLAGLILTVAVHESSLFRPLMLWAAGPETPQNPWPARRFDPTCRLRGWHVLALEVDRLREELRVEDPVLACISWSLPGEIGFYCRGHPDVYSLGLAFGDRHSQYDLWHPNPIADPAVFTGKTFLVIGAGADPRLLSAFDTVGPTQIVTYRENGQVINAWAITIARGYRGFPSVREGGAY